MFGLTGIKLYIIVAGLAVVLIGGVFLWVYNKGETAGADSFKAKTATETVRSLDTARTNKEKADQDVRATPYSDRVDGLR